MKKYNYDICEQEVFITSEEAAFLEAIKNPAKRKEIIRILEEGELRRGSSRPQREI